MVSDPDSDLDRSAEPDRTDGGYDVGLDEQELYLVVRKAVKDAMLDVVGTMVLLGFALGAVWIGLAMAIEGSSTAAFGFGVAVVAFGVLLAASALELLPSVRDRF